MTCIDHSQSKRRLSAKLAAGLALSVFFALGTLAVPASAQGRRDDHRGDRGHGNWGGGYYPAPPVVYAAPQYAPYYAPPPVVYAPGIGISLPGVNIGIR